MNQGSVVQEGTALDLYHRPASEFVARFIGRVNLVAGRVTECTGETVRVEALGTSITASSARKDLAPGAPVGLVVRPESIEIHRNDGSGRPLRASVISRTFLGEKTEYVLRCGDTALQALRYNAGPGGAAAIGGTVSLRFAEGAVTVLPSGPTQ